MRRVPRVCHTGMPVRLIEMKFDNILLLREHATVFKALRRRIDVVFQRICRSVNCKRLSTHSNAAQTCGKLEHCEHVTSLELQ